MISVGYKVSINLNRCGSTPFSFNVIPHLTDFLQQFFFSHLNDVSVVELPYNDYFEYFGPDFKLHISPSNMTNQNSQEYMDKIKYVKCETICFLSRTARIASLELLEIWNNCGKRMLLTS